VPNHVINEVVFRNVTPEQQRDILATTSGGDSPVSFNTLLPIPLNHWLWSAGTKHEKAFPGTALDWCRENWSTKWDAYGISDSDDGRYNSLVQTDDTLILTFRTAWNAPRGWLCALFNKHNLPIEYTYLSEGSETAHVGLFTPDSGERGSWGAQWDENPADEATTRRMHKLLWGVEEFPDEDE
jgi:hypothetical protein